jgi:hypothetical protein
VQAVGRGGDAVLFQQGVEGDEQVQIHMHQGNSWAYKSALAIIEEAF